MSLEYQRAEESEEPARESESKVVFRVPFPWYSVAIAACYAAVFVIQMSSGLEASIRLAGEDKQAVLAGREWWRVLTGTCLHGGLLHFSLNTYALYSFGRDVEFLTNRAHAAIVFLVSTIAGALLSLAVQPEGISVGASGGIIGLVGYLAVYSFRRRAFINPAFRRDLLFNVVFILLYGFLLAQAVDNWAHIGGLITGAVYAAAQVPSDVYEDPREAGSLARTAGILSIAIYAAICVFASLLILRLV